jgi:hypothetical protein
VCVVVVSVYQSRSTWLELKPFSEVVQAENDKTPQKKGAFLRTSNPGLTIASDLPTSARGALHD